MVHLWPDGVRAISQNADEVSDGPGILTVCKVCCACSPWGEQLYKGLLCQTGPNGLTLAGWQAKWAFTAALEVRRRLKSPVVPCPTQLRLLRCEARVIAGMPPMVIS